MHKLLMSAAVLALLTAPALAQSDQPDRGHGQDRPQAEARQPAQPQPAQQAPQQLAPQQLAPQRQAPQQQVQQQQQQGAGRFGHDRGGDRGSPTPATIQQATPSNRDRGGDRGNATPATIQQATPTNRERGGDRGNATPATIQQATPTNRGDRSNDRGYGQSNRGDWNNNRNNNGPNIDNRTNNNRDFNRDGRTDYRRGVNYGTSRHDFSGFRDYRRSFQAPRHFQAPFYRRPAGWYVHRWTFGEFLPAAFWARDYWLNDFSAYDLPPPPYGAVWVRVGGDALLVDEESGEIITVAYAVFY